MTYDRFILFTTIREEIVPHICARIREFLHSKYIDRGPEYLPNIINAYLSPPYADLDVLQHLLDKCKLYIKIYGKDSLDSFINDTINELSDIHKLKDRYNTRLLWYNNTLLCEEYYTSSFEDKHTVLFAVYLKEN